ncbi:LuxR C-terminal-related transcriptional regulator [Nocardiopsis lambiniae]|uniref:LuxR C-terminal-related transcriptional regulator n=1 Tax=Nocardiopsis lambiniae TaxID=3075539 RepID=A0ABU2MG86_9ACTN|nr:LuxR C-terminal-related transcriptional regulator [Nocardiopsis sp. DSM 44743]MDT0331718.1 LuxR C-terminal-related transcriptional regulator [Nocardiopsis sp. DSM 44743]
MTAPARHNLPRPGTGFVGRERDLSSLLRLLDSSRSVTLCGTEGIGKTRLALRVAEQSTAAFPDGVWLADLTDAHTSLEVHARVAHAVGVIEEPGQPLATTVVEALRDRRLLLVLDSCGHVAEAVTEIGETLLACCPEVSVLITALEPVRLSGGTVWRMTPMALPVAARNAPPPDPGDSEAVRLFLDRARIRDPRFSVSPDELETAAVLCDLAGGVPLGIEVLGGSVPGVGPAGLAESLRTHLASPEFRPGPGQAVSRSEVLPIVLDFVYRALPEPERVLLRRLSVFRGWDLESAEQVCTGDDLAETEVLDLLASLLNRSLITITGEFEGRLRYRLPEALRSFAAERLVEADEDETFRERLLDRMSSLAEDLGRKLESSRSMPWSERDSGRRRVVAEYDTLRSLLRWAHREGRAEAGLRLAASLVAHWVSHHDYSEGAHLMDLLLGMDEADKAPSRARALVGRAQLARVRRDHALALSLGEEGLRLCRESGDEVFVRTALNLLALVEVRERVPDQAAVRVEEALRLCRESGDLWGEAIALGTRGALAAQQDDHQTADQHYNAALTLLRGIDHRWGVGVTLIGQARAAELGGDLVTADRCYREALDTQRLIGAPAEEARCLAGIGRVAHAQERTGQAYDYLSEGLLLSHASGQRAEVGRALISIARVAFDSGMRDPACRLAGAAVRMREQLGLPTHPAPWPFAEVERARRRRRRLVALWEQGRALGTAEAVREAERLSEEGRRPPSRRGTPSTGGGAERPRRPNTRTTRPKPTPTPPPPPETTPPRERLTRRELEVARLVSRGKSNPEIARALFITPATAARHIANINRKMGFHSRTQIAAWMDSHGDQN